MSTLQKAILQEADRIINETRVCGITPEHVGGLFAKIGTELGVLDTATTEAKKEAKTYTDTSETAVREFVGQVETGLHRITESLTTTKADKTEVALKASKTETLAKLPVIQGINHPNSYLKQCAMWYQNTGDSDHRGWYLNFGEGTNFYRLQFAGDANQKLGLYLYTGKMSGDAGTSYGGAEILHTGNTAQTVIAGKVTGSYYEPYMPGDCDVAPTGSKYQIIHNLGTDRYIVNITPISTTARSFSVVSKSDNYFEVQFDSTTPFEIQILKY